jgi:hypothetical protein
MDYDPYTYWNARKNPNKSDGVPPWIIPYVSRFTAGVERVFELGPGIGRTFDVYSRGQSLTTLDLSRQYAEALGARAADRGLRLEQHFLEGPAAAFPFPDDAFELGVCLQVLMHVPPQHIAHSMRELARVSQRTIIIAGVNPAWNDKAQHCFNHDYLRVCGEIGCVADAAFVRKDSICFVLRRAEAGPERVLQPSDALGALDD